jgi:nitrogen regulatory protein P-II 1
MKLITAIVRTSALEGVVKSLEETGIRGITISEIRGTGEEMRINSPYTIHDRLEIIVPDEKVDTVSETILRHAKTGFPGDGLIAVTPVDYLIRLRTGEKLE